ncbi:MAG: hypothetical protein D6744_07910 [Planctomycetota bacterium]|nr:MAG: hypothetical protein D6744_07910 [Planctomycetota bacterium]
MRGLIDAPRMRQRRILTPLLARTLALGREQWIDVAYLAVTLAWLGVGVYWSCLLAAHLGRDLRWGWAFVALPAVLVSLERQTVDIGLAALTAGFCLHALQGRRGVYAIAMLAPLARETGWVFPAALAAAALSERPGRERMRQAILAAATVAPGACWFLLTMRTGRSEWSQMTSPIPFAALAERTLRLGPGFGESLKSSLAAGLEHLALAGLWLAIALAAGEAIRRRRGVVAWAAALFAAGLAFVGYPGVWSEAYAFGRVASPLLLLVAVQRPDALGLAPTLLMLPRIAAQLATHAVAPTSL